MSLLEIERLFGVCVGGILRDLVSQCLIQPAYFKAYIADLALLCFLGDRAQLCHLHAADRYLGRVEITFRFLVGFVIGLYLFLDDLFLGQCDVAEILGKGGITTVRTAYSIIFRDIDVAVDGSEIAHCVDKARRVGLHCLGAHLFITDRAGIPLVYKQCFFVCFHFVLPPGLLFVLIIDDFVKLNIVKILVKGIRDIFVFLVVINIG